MVAAALVVVTALEAGGGPFASLSELEKLGLVLNKAHLVRGNHMAANRAAREQKLVVADFTSEIKMKILKKKHYFLKNNCNQMGTCTFAPIASRQNGNAKVQNVIKNVNSLTARQKNAQI